MGEGPWGKCENKSVDGNPEAPTLKGWTEDEKTHGSSDGGWSNVIWEQAEEEASRTVTRQKSSPATLCLTSSVFFQHAPSFVTIGSAYFF